MPTPAVGASAIEHAFSISGVVAVTSIARSCGWLLAIECRRRGRLKRASDLSPLRDARASVVRAAGFVPEGARRRCPHASHQGSGAIRIPTAGRGRLRGGARELLLFIDKTRRCRQIGIRAHDKKQAVWRRPDQFFIRRRTPPLSAAGTAPGRRAPAAPGSCCRASAAGAGPAGSSPRPRGRADRSRSSSVSGSRAPCRRGP